MRNKLIQYTPYAIFSIPFGFWYLSIIVGHDTYAMKLTDIGFISALHIVLSVMFYYAKKDFSK